MSAFDKTLKASIKDEPAPADGGRFERTVGYQREQLRAADPGYANRVIDAHGEHRRGLIGTKLVECLVHIDKVSPGHAHIKAAEPPVAESAK